MKNPLKFNAIIAGLVLVLPLACYSADKGNEKPITVAGAISDSQCAFNVHSDSRSHEWMEKKGVEGAKDDKSCTLRCVKEMGGKFVLVASGAFGINSFIVSIGCNGIRINLGRK